MTTSNIDMRSAARFRQRWLSSFSLGLQRMSSTSHRFSGRQQRQQAFTRMKLLVIISILLLVAFLLLPSVFPPLGHASDQSATRGPDALLEAGRFIIGLAFVLSIVTYGIVRACHYWYRRWLARQSSLQLPRDEGSFKA
jgi:hypothetical protein